MLNQVSTTPYRKICQSYLKRRREGKYEKNWADSQKELIELLIYCKAIYKAPSV